jgi:hypothetical protein
MLDEGKSKWSREPLQSWWFWILGYYIYLNTSGTMWMVLNVQSVNYHFPSNTPVLGDLQGQLKHVDIYQQTGRSMKLALLFLRFLLSDRIHLNDSKIRHETAKISQHYNELYIYLEMDTDWKALPSFGLFWLYTPNTFLDPYLALQSYPTTVIQDTRGRIIGYRAINNSRQRT